MTPATFLPQPLRPFSRGPERKSSVHAKSNLHINPAPLRPAASVHKNVGRELFPRQPDTKKLVERYGENQKVWELFYREVLELGLADYLVEAGIADAECF